MIRPVRVECFKTAKDDGTVTVTVTVAGLTDDEAERIQAALYQPIKAVVPATLGGVVAEN